MPQWSFLEEIELTLRGCHCFLSSGRYYPASAFQPYSPNAESNPYALPMPISARTDAASQQLSSQDLVSRYESRPQPIEAVTPRYAFQERARGLPPLVSPPLEHAADYPLDTPTHGPHPELIHPVEGPTDFTYSRHPPHMRSGEAHR